MTKVRAPLTFDNALSRIAGQIGWPAMAAATERKDRTVRNWGDPDTGESCPIDCALALDLAYGKGGGEGAPMFEVYALRLEADRAEIYADQAELTRRAIAGIKETSEAASAQLACTLPGATPADLVKAVRETEEAIAAETNTLALLKKGAGLVGGVERVSPGGTT